MKDIELKAERAAFEAWWRGDLVDWQGHESVPALHAWEAWQARAAVGDDRAQRVPEGWRLVPVEPTNEMVQAGKVCASAQMVWREMLSAAPTQPAQAEHKTVTPSGTVVTRLELTDKAKESLRANVTHIPGIARHQEPPQQERKPMTDAEIEDLCGEANRGFCIELEDYKKAVRDTERHHGIRE